MARVDWPHRNGRPCVRLVFTLEPGGQASPRNLLADTGAGSSKSVFDLILDEHDCILCGGLPGAAVTLGGAYAGKFPLYDIAVKCPELDFDQHLRAVGVSSVPKGFDGIATFRFLNRFHYGNFGGPELFSLESR
jgi:hypothetical protein